MPPQELQAGPHPQARCPTGRGGLGVVGVVGTGEGGLFAGRSLLGVSEESEPCRAVH